MHVNAEGTEIDILLPDSINLFLFIDFHLCKSATEEQTNSPELSALSEAQITYHFLHCARLIMSEVACNGGPEYTTLISTAERCASLKRNEKINSICLEKNLCRDGFCLDCWEKRSNGGGGGGANRWTICLKGLFDFFVLLNVSSVIDWS